jgi:ribosome-associated protein
MQADEDAWQPTEDQGPSKSQIKREHHALQAMAEAIAHLPETDLAPLGLGDATWEALRETRRIKDQRALRRHYKRIANCLEREHTGPITELLERRAEAKRRSAARHHQIERWRERLINDGDAALTAFIDTYPAAPRQQLRALLRSARSEATTGGVTSGRRLFRLLRVIIDTDAS